jgi:hypothetical protein
VDGAAPVGVRDASVVAVGVTGGVSAGLVPPGLGLRSPGVGLRFARRGRRRAACGQGRGRGVGVEGCATATAAPTTVRNAAAAQMIWARRRKLGTMRRRSATMEGDYKPGRWRWIATLRRVEGCPVSPSYGYCAAPPARPKEPRAVSSAAATSFRVGEMASGRPDWSSSSTRPRDARTASRRVRVAVRLASSGAEASSTVNRSSTAAMRFASTFQPPST